MITNFHIAMEQLGQALFEMYGSDTPEELRNLLTSLGGSYILVRWPESQDYMDDENAIFCGGSEDKTGSSAYFVPIRKVL